MVTPEDQVVTPVTKIAHLELTVGLPREAAADRSRRLGRQRNFLSRSLRRLFPALLRGVAPKQTRNRFDGALDRHAEGKLGHKKLRRRARNIVSRRRLLLVPEILQREYV